MKLFSGLFWAIFLLFSGGVILIRQFVPKQFNVFGVIAGIFVLLIGVSLLTGGISDSTILSGVNKKSFDESTGKASVVFGTSTVDLTQAEEGRAYSLDTVFGKTTVHLPKDKAVCIEADCAFGQVVTPYGVLNGLGSREFANSEFNQTAIHLKVDCVFGQVIME